MSINDASIVAETNSMLNLCTAEKYSTRQNRAGSGDHGNWGGRVAIATAAVVMPFLVVWHPETSDRLDPKPNPCLYGRHETQKP